MPISATIRGSDRLIVREAVVEFLDDEALPLVATSDRGALRSAFPRGDLEWFAMKNSVWFG